MREDVLTPGQKASGLSPLSAALASVLLVAHLYHVRKFPNIPTLPSSFLRADAGFSVLWYSLCRKNL